MALFACWIGFFLLFLGDSAGSTALACAAAVLLILSSVGAGVCAARRSARDNAAAANAALGSSNASTKPFAQSDLLTDRELSIAGLVRSGMSSSQVADKLHIGSSTVRSSLQRIYRKLGIDGIEELRSLHEETDLDTAETAGAADKDASPKPASFPWPLIGLCAAFSLLCLVGLSPYCLTVFPTIQSFGGMALGVFAAGNTGAWTHRLKANGKATSLLLLFTLVACASLIVVACVRSCNGLLSYYSNLQGRYVAYSNTAATLVICMLFSYTSSLCALMCLHDLRRTSVAVDVDVWTVCLFFTASAMLLATMSLVLWTCAMVAATVLLVASWIRSGNFEPAEALNARFVGETSPRPRLISPLATFAFGVTIACPCLVSMGAADVFAPLFYFAAAVSSVFVAAKSGFLRAVPSPASVAALLLHTALCVRTIRFAAFEPLFQTQLPCTAFMILLPYGLLGLVCLKVCERHDGSARQLFLWFATGMLVAAIAARLPLFLKASLKLKDGDALFDGLYAVGFLAFGLIEISAGGLLLLHAYKAPASRTARAQAPRGSAPDMRIRFFMSQNLNETESLVLDGIVRGLSSREIAQELSYSMGTINSARQKGYRQLHVHSAKELVELVSQRGI